MRVPEHTDICGYMLSWSISQVFAVGIVVIRVVNSRVRQGQAAIALSSDTNTRSVLEITHTVDRLLRKTMFAILARLRDWTVITFDCLEHNET
jgi:hypothetical protein